MYYFCWRLDTKWKSETTMMMMMDDMHRKHSCHLKHSSLMLASTTRPSPVHHPAKTKTNKNIRFSTHDTVKRDRDIHYALMSCEKMVRSSFYMNWERIGCFYYSNSTVKMYLVHIYIYTDLQSTFWLEHMHVFDARPIINKITTLTTEKKRLLSRVQS